MSCRKNYQRYLIMDKDKLKAPVSVLFKGQFQHLLLLACLVSGAIYLAIPPWMARHSLGFLTNPGFITYELAMILSGTANVSLK